MIPGPRGAGDIVPAMLSPGEVVLNERQQRMLGADRIMEILARTGGVLGGGRFRTGGVVAAQSFAEQARGARYLSVRPQPPGTFDCSSFAGMAARAAGATVSPPGSTATYIGQISPPQGDDPILFGFRPYRSASQYDGGGDEHMGIRINGVWWESGGRGNSAVGPGKSTDASWTILGVPKGLENLRVTGADDAVGGGGSRPRLTFGQLLEQATRGALGGVVGRTTRTKAGSVTVGTEVSSIAGAYRGAVPDVSAGFDTSPGGADSRAIDRAGRDARAGARAAGKSPEEVRREGDEAEAEATKAWYRREIRQINRAMANLKKRKARLLQSIADLRASRVGRPAAKRMVIRALSGRIAQINAELSELREIRAELQNSLGEIIDAEQMEDYESTASTEDPAATGTGTDAGGAPPFDDAELVRARTNMLMTEWNMVTGGAGDMGTGGVTAMDATFPGGRTVTLTVGATSLVSAVASASGTQGYSTPAVVPAGV